MYRFKKKTLAIAAGTLVVLAATGTAYAFWTGGGTGSGTGTTATGVAVTVTQSTTALADMYPGDAPQTLSGTFANATGAKIHVTQLVVSIASVTQANGSVGACTTDDYTLPISTITNTSAAGWDVPAGGSIGWTGATIQFNNSISTNQDGCKGATVTLGYVAT